MQQLRRNLSSLSDTTPFCNQHYCTGQQGTSSPIMHTAHFVYLSTGATRNIRYHKLARCMMIFNHAMPCDIHRISNTSSAEKSSQPEAPPLGSMVIAFLHAVSMPASFPAGRPSTEDTDAGSQDRRGAEGTERAGVQHQASREARAGCQGVSKEEVQTIL